MDLTQQLQQLIQSQDVTSLQLSRDEQQELARLLLTGDVKEVDITLDSYSIMRNVHIILCNRGFDVVLRKQLKGSMEYPHINIRGLSNTAVGIRTLESGDREFVIAEKCSNNRLWTIKPLLAMKGRLMRCVLRLAALQDLHTKQTLDPLI